MRKLKDKGNCEKKNSGKMRKYGSREKNSEKMKKYGKLRKEK